MLGWASVGMSLNDAPAGVISFHAIRPQLESRTAPVLPLPRMLSSLRRSIVSGTFGRSVGETEGSDASGEESPASGT